MKTNILDQLTLLVRTFTSKFLKWGFIILFMSINNNISAATYYVSGASGSNNPPPAGGTFLNPWLDISYGLGQVQSGDIIYVFNDAIYSGQITWPNIDGIKLRGYKIIPTAEFPTITGNNSTRIMLMQAYVLADALTPTTEVRDFVFENGTVTGNGGGLCMIGFVAPSLINIKFKFCTSNNGSGGAIYYRKYSDYTGCGNWDHYMQPCLMMDLFFQGNYAPVGAGGAVFIEGTNQIIDLDFPQIDPQEYHVRMTNCQFIENSCARTGGALGVAYAGVAANAIIMSDNIARDGGAISLVRSISRFNEITLRENTASRGGAIFVLDGLQRPENIPDCNSQVWYYHGLEHIWSYVDMDYNEAAEGGGLYMEDMLADSTKDFISLDYQYGRLYNNYATGSGGGIFLRAGINMNLFNLSIQLNTADANGGGIYNPCSWNNTTQIATMDFHHIEQCLITNNTALLYGGGIYTQQSFSCINSTIASNSATYVNGFNSGGGIACYSFQNGLGQNQQVAPTFYNTIIWHNTGGTSNQVYLDDNYCLPQFNYCDIQNFNTGVNHDFDGAGAVSWYNLGWSCGPTMIESDPQFVDVTMLNYHLLATVSPCINTGNLTLCSPTGFPQFGSINGFPYWGPNGGIDFDGSPRVLNNIDMGPYELSAKNGFPQLTGNLDTNSNEITIFPNPCHSGQSIKLISNNESTKLTHVEIRSILGKLIFSQDLNNIGSYEIFNDPALLGDLSGILFIKVETINSHNNAQISVYKKLILN